MGFFCIWSAVIGYILMMVFALLEYNINNVRAKVVFNRLKWVATGLAVFGTTIIALAAFG